MPRELIELPLPIRGLDLDNPEKYLRQGFTPELTNFLIERGRLVKRKGFDEQLASPPGTGNIMEGFEYGDSSGNLHLVFGSTDKFMEYNSGDTWSDRSGTDFTGDEEDHIFFATVGGSGATNLYIHNTKDPIKTWSGSGNASALSLTGFSTLIANTMLGYRGHLLLGGTTEDGTYWPYRIRWSNIADPTTWNGVTAGFVDLIEDKENSAILNLSPFRNIFVAYKEQSIYNVSYDSNAQSFVGKVRIQDRGIIGPKAVCPVQNGARHLVVTEDNILLYNGFDFDEPPIGDRIKSQFFSELDFTKRKRIFCMAVPERYEAWILCPDDYAYVWNWSRDAWSKVEFAETIHSMIYTKQFFSGRRTLLGNATNQLMRMFNTNADDGAAITATMRTPLSDMGALVRKTIHRIELDSIGLPKVDIYSSNNLLDTTTATPAVKLDFADVNGKHKVDIPQDNQNGRYLSTRITDATSNNIEIAGIREDIEFRESSR
jgi:hypothetical protein